MLHIQDDGSFNTPEIKDAYRRLSKKYHPDKVDWKKFQGQEEKVKKRWENLVQAYETLSKSEKFKNWKEFGHPEGALTVKAVELLLPAFLMDKEMKPMLYTALFLIIVGVVLGTVTW